MSFPVSSVLLTIQRVHANLHAFFSHRGTTVRWPVPSSLLYCFFGFAHNGEKHLPPSIRILVADDYEGWRRQASLMLQVDPILQVICEASDGSEAVQKAEEFRPDLILLDIGLPKLNGLEVARQIRKVAPESKIIFLTQESSADVVQEALRLGAHGYVVKERAGTELVPAVLAVLQGKQFISSGVTGYFSPGVTDASSS